MNYDVIIVGAGHNGLVAAAKLAKAGKKVLVLERRPIVGGAAVTEEPYPGFRYTTCSYSPGMFQESIARELDLRKLGYETIECDPVLYAPAPDGNALWFWQDHQKTADGIAPYSKLDASRYVGYQKEVERLVSFIRPLFYTPLPDPATAGPADWKELLSLAWKFHKLREKDVLELLRVLPNSIHDYLQEFFEGEHLKGVLASEGIMGSFYGPRSQGSVYVMMYLRLGRGDGSKQDWPFIRGGMGSLSNAIAKAAQNHGAEIRTGVEVSKILIQNERATGVVLPSGQEITARVVVSNADAKRTFLKMVDPLHLDPSFVIKIRSIKSRGVSAKVNLALDRYPKWKGLKGETNPANVCIAPSMDYLERAFDDAKYGNYSKSPYLDIAIPSVVDPSVAPTGKHVMSVYVLFAPYHLKGDWNAKREEFGNNVIRTIEEHAPGFTESILHKQVVTPLDLETEFGMTEGHIHHGEMSLDQILFMRPVSGYSRYRTPIEGLYVCGASAHPGGGVTGLPGSISAGEILADFKSGKVPQA